MKHFKMSILKLIVLSIGACTYINHAYAGFFQDPMVKSYGANTLIGVWQHHMNSTRSGIIQGASGLPGSWTPTDISDPANYDAYQRPQLAVAQNPAVTMAIAAWISRAVSDGSKLVQGAYLTTGGWSSTITFSASDNSLELPIDDSVKVDISADGTTIGVTWFAAIGMDARPFAAYSTDGGTTWTVDNLAAP